jgi:hypothetical protein
MSLSYEYIVVHHKQRLDEPYKAGKILESSYPRTRFFSIDILAALPYDENNLPTPSN